MSLIIKPPSWGHCTTNFTGTPPAVGSLGTAFTAGASNADGTAVSVLANIAHDVEYLVIGVSGTQTPAANSSSLMDILVDPVGGSTWAAGALINDLIVGEGGVTTAATPVGYWYHFPIWLKSGNSIGVQARTANGVGVAGRVCMFAYGGNANPASWWCGTTVESIGITAASSQGTNHTPGNAGAFSAWTNLGSPLSAPCGAVQYAVQGTNTDTTQNAAQYFFEFGVGSTRIGPPLWRATSINEQGWTSPQGVTFAALPSGAQLQVRGTCSATAEIIDVAAYAVM